jgi:hypothetical protein
MNVLAESDNFQVYNEYERVFLNIKQISKVVYIGDFYGDPQVALISENEKYCVMGGAGIIIYYFSEPYEEYSYTVQSTQWKEWGRESPQNTKWANNIFFIDGEHVGVETEDMEQFTLYVF